MLCFLYEHRYRLCKLLASGLWISVCRTQFRWMPSAENIVSVPESQRFKEFKASEENECTASKPTYQSKVMAPPLLFLVEFLSASSTALTIRLTGWILQMTEIQETPAEISCCSESCKICKSSNLSTAEACALSAFSLPPASTWSNCPGWSDRDALFQTRQQDQNNQNTWGPYVLHLRKKRFEPISLPRKIVEWMISGSDIGKSGKHWTCLVKCMGFSSPAGQGDKESRFSYPSRSEHPRSPKADSVMTYKSCHQGQHQP